MILFIFFLQTEVASIRDRFYGFVQFAPDNDVAVDLSFGVIGFTLTLARAFREVRCVREVSFYVHMQRNFTVNQLII